MASIIKDLYQAYTLLEFDDSEKKKTQLELLDDLRNFAFSGTYTTTKHKEYLLKNYNEPILKQAKDLGLSDAGVYKNRKLILRDLERYVGANIIKEILKGDLDKAEKIIVNATSGQTLDDIVIETVVDSIKDLDTRRRRSNTYNLEDCTNEIKFLRVYSRLLLETRLELMDSDKLNYLLSLLSYEDANVEDRLRLLEVIKG